MLSNSPRLDLAALAPNPCLAVVDIVVVFRRYLSILWAAVIFDKLPEYFAALPAQAVLARPCAKGYLFLYAGRIFVVWRHNSTGVRVILNRGSIANSRKRLSGTHVA